MQEWILGGLGLVAVLAALLYLGAPLLVMQQFWMRPDAPIEEVDPSQLDPGVAAYFDRACDELARLGFVDLGVFSLTGIVPNVRSAFRLMVNADARTLAMAAWMRGQAGDKPMPDKLYVEFSSETRQGRTINTNNGTDLPSADRNPDTISHFFPGLTDLSLLWQIHRGVLRELPQPAELRPIPLDQPPEALLHHEFRREMEKKAARGYWKATGEGRYRPTLKGGYVMTWGELPPFKQWRARRARQSARELRARLGL